MTASELILKKALVASDLDSSQWNQVQAGFRNRAFFSSRVAEVKIITAMRDRVADYVKSGVDISEARKLMRKDLEALKYSPNPGEEDTIKDLFSKARLDVILKTNEAQARGYIEHIARMKPGAFAAFPAQEFLRVESRKAQRQDWPARWRKAGGKIYGDRMIALKDDPVWVNLSVFGNPFPPFDWGSGMGVRGVDRDEAEKLGLITREELKKKVEALRNKPVPDFNGNLQATVPNLRSDSLCGKILKKNFGDQVKIENSVVSWEGNLVQDVLAGHREKARLGDATHKMLKKLRAVATTEDFAALKRMNPTFNRQTFEQHAIKHKGSNETRLKDNIPLTDGDYELMPEAWRNPDRITKLKEHHYALELETLDGGFLQLTVNTMRGFSSFYKTRLPLGATSGNAPGIP